MSNVEIVRGLYRSFAERDIDSVRRALDESVDWGQPEALPWGGHYRGPDEVLQFFAAVAEHIDGLAVEVDEYVDGGEVVVALGWASGRSTQSGNPFRVRLAHAWKFRDRRVTWFYNYVDTAAMAAAIGVGGSA